MSPDSPRRPFLKRTFGPLRPGAMRGAIFAFLAGSMGLGIFNQPFRANQVGIINYSLALLAATLFSFLGMYLIAKLIRRHRVESYSAMSELAYGSNFRRVADFCLIAYPWGNTICFQILFAKFLLELLADTFHLPLYEGEAGRQSEVYSELGTALLS
jgi:amino acid permease